MKALHCTELITRRFLLYWLIASSHELLGKCDEAAHGTKRLQTHLLFSTPIELPPIATQQRIADILSTYDRLIDNNNRRIALLEESIHQLYKEWFVRSRFPGYKLVKVVDGIPEGWSKAPATQVIDFNPKTSAPKGEVRPYLPMEAVSTNSMIISEIDTRPVGGGAKFKNGDTLLARITPCLENGKTAFVQFMEDDNMVATGSTEFIVMRSTQVTPYWVYCLVRSHNFRQHAINSMAGSDGRQRVKPDCFGQYTVLCSPLQILKYFDNIASPIFKQIKYLNLQNQKLKEARDLLLPRLSNGSIAV
ncbi:MAG: restriction endonuclease subunit S [Nostoc sp.]|uniref:restriction endonuclease subunit S n=1 Tax=Nostoc sp. TaxID=1180 RepID=UPI002FF56AEA